MVVIYVIFLGVVPLIVVIFVLKYCFRPKILHHCNICLRKRAINDGSDHLDNSGNCRDASVIRHSLLNKSAEELNNDPVIQEINPAIKNNSVMYSNMDILSQKSLVNENSLNKIPNTQYANFKMSNIQKLDLNVKNEYDNTDNLKYANSRKTPVKIGKSFNHNVDAIPSKGSNTSIDNNLYDTPVRVFNFPRNHLQKDTTRNLNNP